MDNIIVTGGAGFIGSNFIKKHIGRYNIINLDCLTYASNIEYLKDISKLKNYKFFKLNILDTKKVLKIIEKFIDQLKLKIYLLTVLINILTSKLKILNILRINHCLILK